MTLAAQRPADVAIEFQTILHHRGIVLADPMDAIARLQLARALALSGDSVKAKAAYQDLLNLALCETVRALSAQPIERVPLVARTRLARQGTASSDSATRNRPVQYFNWE